MNRHVDGEEAVRTLLYIPIIHTQTDLGDLSESARGAKLRRFGKQMWQRHLQSVEQRWSEIEKTIEALPLPYDRLRIYQDGLPICGREKEIAADLAEAGSRNYRLISRLQENGATLMGTESPELLLEEYQLMKESLASGVSTPATLSGTRRQELSDALLERRDRFIAARINDTLNCGETGILFLGLLHTAAEWLAPDIRVNYPVHQPHTTARKKR